MRYLGMGLGQDYRINRLFGNYECSMQDEMGRIELLVWCKVLSIMDMLYVAKSYGVKGVWK
ncbi:MAG: hypothetical protein ACK4F9_04290 [Brevinematia bacterium]